MLFRSGMISSYSLGESVKLVVEPGYWEEGMSIAQYPDDMPTLEVEVRLWEREGKIPFGGFGEIKSDAEPVGQAPNQHNASTQCHQK